MSGIQLAMEEGGGGNEGNGSVGAVFAGGQGAVSRIYLTLRGNGEASRSVGGVDGGKGGKGFPVGGSVDGDKGGMICWDGDDGLRGDSAGFEGFEVGGNSVGFVFGDGMDGDEGGMVGGHGDVFPVGGSVNSDKGGMVGGDGVGSDSAELERIKGAFAAGAKDRWRRDDGALGGEVGRADDSA